jgi:hypothetical protein
MGAGRNNARRRSEQRPALLVPTQGGGRCNVRSRSEQQWPALLAATSGAGRSNNRRRSEQEVGSLVPHGKLGGS